MGLVINTAFFEGEPGFQKAALLGIWSENTYLMPSNPVSTSEESKKKKQQTAHNCFTTRKLGEERYI